MSHQQKPFAAVVASALFLALAAGSVVAGEATTPRSTSAERPRTTLAVNTVRFAGTFQDCTQDGSRATFKVQEVTQGDKTLQGRNLTLSVEWIAEGGKRMPDPRMTAAIRELRHGDRVAVMYDALQNNRIRELRVTEHAPQGTIFAGQLVYKEQSAPAWLTKGRIVGPVSGAPMAEISLDSDSKSLGSMPIKLGARAYETPLLPPGTYRMRVKADGFKALELPKVTVKAGNDLLLPLTFTSVEAEQASVAGFIGLVRGVLREKSRDSFALEVTDVVKLSPQNRATNPKGLVGMRISVSIQSRDNRQAEEMIKTLLGLAAGDAVEVGIRQLEARRFAAVEVLQKAAEEKPPAAGDAKP